MPGYRITVTRPAPDDGRGAIPLPPEVAHHSADTLEELQDWLWTKCGTYYQPAFDLLELSEEQLRAGVRTPNGSTITVEADREDGER